MIAVCFWNWLFLTKPLTQSVTLKQVCLASTQMFLMICKNCVNLTFFTNENQTSGYNKLTVTSKGTVRVPIIIDPKQYEHAFDVLMRSKADCFMGLDFLRTHKCDALFSKVPLRLDSKNHLQLYHRKLNHDVNTVFCVKATETVRRYPSKWGRSSVNLRTNSQMFFHRIKATSSSAMPQGTRLMFTQVQSQSNYGIEDCF